MLPLATFNAAALVAGYTSVNSPGFLKPIFFMRIVNASNSPVTISFDGVTDHEYLPINGEFNFAVQQNAQPNSQLALISAYTQVYVKGAAGVGFITVSGYYV
jgi:hypothetical protein